MGCQSHCFQELLEVLHVCVHVSISNQLLETAAQSQMEEDLLNRCYRCAVDSLMSIHMMSQSSLSLLSLNSEKLVGFLFQKLR